MKSLSVISAVLSVLALISQVRSQEPLTDAEKALFDDLQVTEAPEKSARERMEKAGAPPRPQPDLPAAAAKMLDRLAVFEASIDGITDEAIAQSRKTLSAQLINLSNTAAEPRKTELIGIAKSIEGLELSAALPAPGTDSAGILGEWKNRGSKAGYSFAGDGTIKTSWNTKGTWRWLNGSHDVIVGDYEKRNSVQILRMVPMAGRPTVLNGFNDSGTRFTMIKAQPAPSKPGTPVPEASRLIEGASTRETEARAVSFIQIKTRRERVAAWLVEIRCEVETVMATSGSRRPPIRPQGNA